MAGLNQSFRQGIRVNDETRLELLLSKTRAENKCLIWTGSTGHNGYGKTKRRGKYYRAHRLAWELTYGAVPEGMMLDHTCHNRACINVEHLRTVTNQQNQMNRSGANSGRKYDLPRGVYVNQSRGNPYVAIITKDRKLRRLGTFATVEEALTVRRAAEVEMFGQYAGS